jgi:hypothetical protein
MPIASQLTCEIVDVILGPLAYDNHVVFLLTAVVEHANGLVPASC